LYEKCIPLTLASVALMHAVILMHYIFEERFLHANQGCSSELLSGLGNGDYSALVK